MPSRCPSGVDLSMSPLSAGASPSAPPAPLAPHVPPSGRPHHVAHGIPLSPRRRDHIPQPPSLTTSLGGLQFQGGGHFSVVPTPTTTLSSPFSQTISSPYTQYTPSPGAALRGSSPMASRQSSGYASAYNPQEWVPVVASPQLGAAPFLQIQPHSGQTRQQQLSNGQCSPLSPVAGQKWTLSF
jgi:hypothetical protein